MDEKSGWLKISHDRAIDDLTLAVDQGLVLEDDHVVEVVAAAAVDPVVPQKADHALNLGLEVKIVHVPDQKVENLDQRASLK